MNLISPKLIKYPKYINFISDTNPFALLQGYICRAKWRVKIRKKHRLDLEKYLVFMSWNKF